MNRWTRAWIAAVLAMGGVTLWRRDPTASPALVYALVPITATLAACTVALLRSYARDIPPRRPPGDAGRYTATRPEGNVYLAATLGNARRNQSVADYSHNDR